MLPHVAILPRRRSTAKPVHSITAAATRIDLTDPRKAVKQIGRRQAWQEDAWAFFDEMAEVKFTTWWAGNAVSQVRLIAAVEPENDGDEPIRVDDPESGISPATAAIAQDEVRRLRSRIGGQAEILRAATQNIDVVGECWLIGFGARDEIRDLMGNVSQEAAPEDWVIRSVDEVVNSASGIRVRSHEGDPGRILDKDIDTAIRIYQRHPRWSDLADCGMRGILADCEALMTFSAEQMAQSRSRHNAGILLIPNGLSTGKKPAQPEATDSDASTDTLLVDLDEGLSTPTDDPLDKGAVVPTFLMGDAADLKEVRWLDLGRKAAADLDDRIEKRITRVARGLNAPVEVVMGHQNTTYANAEQVDADEFEDFHRPRLLLLCDSFTSGFMRPNMLARGADPDETSRVMIWFDASGLLAEPDMGPAADIAHSKLVISDDAYRGYRKFKDSDAPDDDELLRRTGMNRGTLSDSITLALLKMLDPGLEVVPIPKVTEPMQGATDAPVQAIEPAAAMCDESTSIMLATALTRTVPEPRRAVMAATLARLPLPDLVNLAVRHATAVTAAGRVHRSRTQIGRSLMEIDRELRTRLLTLADAELGQALERAGNRIRGKAGTLRELTAQIPAKERAAHVGPALIAAAGVTDDDLLAGAFDTMEQQFLEWGATAQADAMNLVGRAVGGFDTAAREALQLRQASDLGEAWDWLHGTLSTLAQAKLYDPTPSAAALGEVGTTTVPPGVIREAISRAGGAAGLTTTPSGGAYVTVTDSATRPAGGIGTGDLMRDALFAGGATVEGFEWVYGPGSRRNEFEPHLELDGVEFENFDSDVLSNDDSFPETAFYMPGDHGGCQCDVSPIIMSATDSAGLSTEDDQE